MQDFPCIPLAVLSTPIQKLENISRLLNTNVYIKRDDLTGIGLGGNKVRKLEFLLADAKRKGNQLLEYLMDTDVRFMDTDSYDDIYEEMDRVGKAFAGLVKMAREGQFKPTDNVLYLYSGGAGGLFAIDIELD
ncbi:hypothetical protein [Hominenteromicrobium sp.]|uniref:hypothetical protein n=1 Tax=Hominenteromicrobium sp. TaxID=3073581 RepID=UPI003A8DC772